MRSQLSLLQTIGLFLSYASAFFLVSMIDSPLGTTPFWIVAAALAAFLTIPIATAIVIVTAQLCLGRPQTSSQKE